MPFADLNLHPSLLRAIKELGYARPTPIQAEAIPPALLGREKKKQALERGEIYAPRTGEELEKEILTLKNEEVKLLPSPRDQKPLPERPAFFHSELDHFKWARDYRRRGGTLSEAELIFVAGFEGRMSPAQAEHWQAENEMFAQAEIQGGQT